MQEFHQIDTEVYITNDDKPGIKLKIRIMSQEKLSLFREKLLAGYPERKGANKEWIDFSEAKFTQIITRLHLNNQKHPEFIINRMFNNRRRNSEEE